MALILIMADGVGLAPASADNPLADAPTPALRALLGGPLTLESARRSGDLLLRPVDATLGVDGLPQSGTGHTTILGGFNAAALHGRHQPNFPPVALRGRLAEQSLFHMVAPHGGAAFANVFGPNYRVALASGRLRKAASALAAEGAGVRLRTIDDLQAGQAVAWDITGELLREREPAMPIVSPAAAAAALQRLAESHALVYFESYLPDLAAHARLAMAGDAEAQTRHALGLLDALLGALLELRRAGDTVALISDHGNCESRSAGSHTRNPVPLLAVGPHAAQLADVASIAELAGAVAGALGGEARAPHR